MLNRHQVHFCNNSTSNNGVMALISATFALLLLMLVATCSSSFTPHGSVIATLSSSTIQQAFYDSQGRIVFFDYGSMKVRRMDLNGAVVDLASTGVCYYLTEGPSQELYLSLNADHKIQKLDAAGFLNDFAGSGTAGHDDGVGTFATFSTPNGIIYFALHGALYVSEDGAIRKIVVSTRTVTTVVKNATYFAQARHLTITRNGNYIYSGFKYVTRIDVATGAFDILVDATGGNITGNLTTARIGYVGGYALSLNETRLMIGDSEFNLIRQLNLCAE